MSVFFFSCQDLVDTVKFLRDVKPSRDASGVRNEKPPVESSVHTHTRARELKCEALAVHARRGAEDSAHAHSLIAT